MNFIKVTRIDAERKKELINKFELFKHIINQ